MEFLDIYMFTVKAISVVFWVWVLLIVYKKFKKWRAMQLSQKLTDLYWDALNVYIQTGDQESMACQKLLLKIFDQNHRETASQASFGYINALLNREAGELSSDKRARSLEMLRIFDLTQATENPTVYEVAFEKNSVAQKYPSLVDAINSFDNSYIKRKFPSHCL